MRWLLFVLVASLLAFAAVMGQHLVACVFLGWAAWLALDPRMASQ